MAELFLKQGKPGRALAIYRQVVRDRPADLRARRRLAELEAQASAERGVTMSFREHIQGIVDSVPGATACTVMGVDGISIDTYEVGGADVDVSSLIIEYASAVQQLWRSETAAELGGSVGDLVISSDKVTTLLRAINSEYLLAVVLSSNAIAGHARFLMRMAAPKLRKELE